MKLPTTVAALVCAALALPAPAFAMQTTEDAETVREFNMMLMATSLRCRTSGFDFRREYESFTRHNLHHLNRAHDEVKRSLVARFGEERSQRELERFDADMANRYGGGHPSLNCAQLRDWVVWLAEPMDEETIVDVAWELLYPASNEDY